MTVHSLNPAFFSDSQIKECPQLITTLTPFQLLSLHLNFDTKTYMNIENVLKELSLCHKLKFSNPNIFATQCRRPQIFQTMNSVRSNSVSLKYQRPTPSGCKDIGVRKFEFVAKTQFFCYISFKSRYSNFIASNQLKAGAQITIESQSYKSLTQF